MNAGLDPYRDWLGLTGPIHHYSLLGLPEFTADAATIQAAAAQRRAIVNQHVRSSPTAAIDLLAKIGAAESCLADAEQRATYDAQLRRQLRAAPPAAPIASAASGFGADDEASDDLLPPAVAGSAGYGAPPAAPPGYPSAPPYGAPVAQAVPAYSAGSPPPAAPYPPAYPQAPGYPPQAHPAQGYAGPNPPGQGYGAPPAPPAYGGQNYAGAGYGAPPAPPYAGAPMAQAVPLGSGAPMAAPLAAPIAAPVAAPMAAPLGRPATDSFVRTGPKLRHQKKSSGLALYIGLPVGAAAIGALVLFLTGSGPFAPSTNANVARNNPGQNPPTATAPATDSPATAAATPRSGSAPTSDRGNASTRPNAANSGGRNGQSPGGRNSGASRPAGGMNGGGSGSSGANSPASAANGNPTGGMNAPAGGSSPGAMTGDSGDRANRSPADSAALTAALAATRYYIGQRNLEQARAQLDAAADIDGKHPEVASLRTFVHFTSEFWKAVRESAKGLDGGSQITIQGIMVGVVEINSDDLVLRREGRNVTYRYDDMPRGLAVGLAENWLDKNSPVSTIILAVGEMSFPTGDRDKARQLLQTAIAGGQERQVGPLLPELDIPLPTELPKAGAVASTGSSSPAMNAPATSAPPASGTPPTGAKPADGRQPAPAAAQLAEARKEVKQRFAAELRDAKTGEARLALATRLQTEAEESPQPAARYALLLEARDLRIAAEDFDAALQTAEPLAAGFEVDDLELKTEIIEEAGKTAEGDAVNKRLAEAALALGDEQVLLERSDLAVRTLRVALAAARKSRDGELLKEAAAREKEVRDLRRAS